MKTPVIFIVFRRPDLTQQVFNKIREAKPEHLYVVADGPRNENKEDKALCKETRSIIDQVDWNCKVTKDFSAVNLGCRHRPHTGITNAFKQFDQAIILEDDCLPHTDFFKFCEEMLIKYKTNQEIMHITGGNFNNGKRFGSGSYYFSQFPNIWGWATWKRAWAHYDHNLVQWPLFKFQNRLENFLSETKTKEHLQSIFDSLYAQGSTTWAIQWLFSVLNKNGLCITPQSNLIKNIGTNEASTHMDENDMWISKIEFSPLDWPLKHPNEIEKNLDADKIFEKKFIHPRKKIGFISKQKRSLRKRINKLKSILS